MTNPFDKPAPAPASNPWVTVLPVPTAVTVPTGTAVDRATGAVLYEDDGVTPYNETNLLNDWRIQKDRLDKLKQIEADLRGKVVACYADPEKQEGTENLELGKGWKVKVAKKLSHNLKSFDEGVSTNDAVVFMLTKLANATVDSQGNALDPSLGALCASRLVSWKPTISVSEYKLLTPGHKAIVDNVLEIKQAAPTVELVPPKEP